MLTWSLAFRRWFIFSLLLMDFFLRAASAHAVSLALDQHGTLHGAPYRIVVPVQWNHTLLVYARGTGSAANPDRTLGLTPLTNVPGSPVDAYGLPDNGPARELEQTLLAEGYALAVSDYRDALFRETGLLGWIVESGLQDIQALTQYFAQVVRPPSKTILWARSQGSLIALKSIEAAQDSAPPAFINYDGVITGCTVGAGASRSWASAIDLALAYDVVFPNQPQGGWLGGEQDGNAEPIDNIDNYVVFAGPAPQAFPHHVPPVLPTLLAQLSDPRNFGRFEFIRLVNRLPLAAFYPRHGIPYLDQNFSWLLVDMLFATEVRADVERKAGGPVGQNPQHVYTLSAADKAYLARLGLDATTADRLLASMNARHMTATAPGTTYLQRFADFTGKLRRPVISMHTVVDGLVLPSQETEYRETVAAAGKSQKLVQIFVDRIGHCTFTPAQWLATVHAMDAWLRTGAPPGNEFFPAEVGFVRDFDPGPYPQPPP